METNLRFEPRDCQTCQKLRRRLLPQVGLRRQGPPRQLISVFDVMGLKSLFAAALLQNVQYPSHVN